MRIGVDLLAIQAPSCRGRGIGRYARSILKALLAQAPDWEYVFYRRADLEIDWDESPGERHVRWIDVAPDDQTCPDGTLQRLVQVNPDRLDWLLIPNPVVERRGFALPEPVPGGPRLAAIVYDLIPNLFPKHYLNDPLLAAESYRDLRRLQGYDLILAISEATGRDVHERMGVPRRRIVNVRAAADPAFFFPARDESDARQDDLNLDQLGLREPFLYYLGNVDWRKNVLGLVDAYARLPETVRGRYPLILTFGRNAWFSAVLNERLEALGLGDRVRATGPLTDEVVRSLYRRCALFLSPSLYEGFGLPILEAMQCGAAVVVADNSSQPEVIGTAGVLAATDDPTDWANKISELVVDPDRLSSLRAAALEQASRFYWDDSARRLRDAIGDDSIRDADSTRRRPGLVLYPAGEGAAIDPSTASLVRELEDACRPVVFLDGRCVASLPPFPMKSGWYETRLLSRIRPILGNSPLLYLVAGFDRLASLIGDLESNPGGVAFTAQWAASGPPTRREAVAHSLREVVRLAESVICHDEGFHRDLLSIAGTADRKKIGLARCPSGRDMAEFYGAWLRAS